MADHTTPSDNTHPHHGHHGQEIHASSVHLPSASHDYAAANQRHFDQNAQKFDDMPNAIVLSQKFAKVILQTYPRLFDEESTSVMDYACGTGLLSRELCSHVKTVVGVDISQGMVDQYNLRVANQGIPPEEMRALRAELKGDGTELDGARFDVIVCTAAYHHFASIDEVTRVLTSFLKPGGSLLVADILKQGEDRIVPEQYHDYVAHSSGFSEEDMRRNFEEAGLGEFRLTPASSATFHGRPVKFFLARGVKPVQVE